MTDRRVGIRLAEDAPRDAGVQLERGLHANRHITGLDDVDRFVPAVKAVEGSWPALARPPLRR